MTLAGMRIQAFHNPHQGLQDTFSRNRDGNPAAPFLP
jgi:hypothetical protein